MKRILDNLVEDHRLLACAFLLLCFLAMLLAEWVVG